MCARSADRRLCDRRHRYCGRDAEQQYSQTICIDPMARLSNDATGAKRGSHGAFHSSVHAAQFLRWHHRRDMALATRGMAGRGDRPRRRRLRHVHRRAADPAIHAARGAADRRGQRHAAPVFPHLHGYHRADRRWLHVLCYGTMGTCCVPGADGARGPRRQDSDPAVVLRGLHLHVELHGAAGRPIGKRSPASA
jgi:hypothetical protein